MVLTKEMIQGMQNVFYILYENFFLAGGGWTPPPPLSVFFDALLK